MNFLVLVQHDQIKHEILRQHALPLLINNFQIFNNQSQRLILESIGSMTFYKESARLLRENKSFLNIVENKQQTKDDGIRKAADKIIWNLIKEPEKVAKIKEKKEQKIEDQIKKEEYEYDIMISYCHADKELVHKVHRFLADQGFKIWIDQEQMYGPAMQAMAQAVENSEFVILCMSSSYKRSVYCQAEAEYAFQCKRRLLPLIVRQEYRPDGWLGLLIGSRIYVDFGKLDFKAACELLINEIKLQRKEQNRNGKDAEHTPEKEEKDLKKIESSDHTLRGTLLDDYIHRHTSSSAYHSIILNQWTSKDTLDFLFDSKLYLMMPLCETLNGHGIIKLFEMCQRDPTHFYTQLNDELHSRFNQLLPIGVYTQFLTEIDDRIGSNTQPEENSETASAINVPPKCIISTENNAKNDDNNEIISSTPVLSRMESTKSDAPVHTQPSSPTNSIQSKASSNINVKKVSDPIPPTPPLLITTKNGTLTNNTSLSNSSMSRSNSISSEISSKSSRPTTPKNNLENKRATSTITSMKNGQSRSIPLPSPTQFTTIY